MTQFKAGDVVRVQTRYEGISWYDSYRDTPLIVVEDDGGGTTWIRRMDGSRCTDNVGPFREDKMETGFASTYLVLDPFLTACRNA